MHKSNVVDATGWGNSCSDIHDVGWGGDFSHSSTGGLTSSFASAESLWTLGVSFLFWLENPSTEFHNTQNNFTLDLSSTKRSPRSRRFFLAPRCIHRRWESGEGELENGGECYIEIRVSSHKPMKSEDLILSEKVFFLGLEDKNLRKVKQMIEDITDRPIWVDLKGKDPHPIGLSEDAGDNDSYKRRCCCSYGVARYYIYIYIFWMGFLMRERKCTCQETSSWGMFLLRSERSV